MKAEQPLPTAFPHVFQIALRQTSQEVRACEA